MIIKLDGPKTKQEFADLVASFGYKVGVEIGVREAELATLILQTPHVERYYLVDPWSHQESGYHPAINIPQSAQDANYKTAMERIRPYEERTVVLRMCSHEAASFVDKVDWIYIDGNHAYADLEKPGVRQDLHLWVPKVREGGMAAGHDFMDEQFPERFGVRTAVLEYFPEDQVLHTVKYDNPINPPIWWTLV